MSHFLPPIDHRLNEISQEVPANEIQSQAIQDIVDRMLQLSRGERNEPDKGGLVGLALLKSVF